MKITVFNTKKLNFLILNYYDDIDVLQSNLIHKYGAHIFHTNHKKVWDFLSQFSDFYPYFHKVNALVLGKLVPIPFNLDSLFVVFPDDLATKLTNKLLEIFPYGERISILELLKYKDLEFLANFIYKNIFENYTLKQWNLSPNDLDSSVLNRVCININKNDCYFNDKYQGIPLRGYTNMMKNMIANPLIKVCLNTDFKNIKINSKRIFYTGAIDEYFDYIYSPLPYVSLDFKIKKFNKEYFQNNSVVNFPNNHDYTRIIEHKYFLDQKTKHTSVSFEYPSQYDLNSNKEAFYPIPNKINQALYEKYQNKTRSLKNVYFLGRLGKYKYLNIDEAILESLNLFENLNKGIEIKTKKDKNPLVSIIMPNYNTEAFLPYAIESVLNQSFRDFELIIIDDASSDNSQNIIKEFSKKDKRIIPLLYSTNQGVSNARNHALNEAKGKYIAFLDSDDYWSRDKLLAQITFMEEKNINFSYTSYYTVDEDNEIIEEFYPREQLNLEDILKSCDIGNSTAIYNKEALGGISSGKTRHDYEIWLKILKVQENAHKVPNLQQECESLKLDSSIPNLESTPPHQHNNLKHLSFIRLRKNSDTYNKLKSAKLQWKIYKEILNLPLNKRIYYFCNYMILGIKKHIFYRIKSEN